MGLFSSLFGGQKKQPSKVQPKSAPTKSSSPKKTASDSLAERRKMEEAFFGPADIPVPPSDGKLTDAQKMVLLYLSENYKVSETKYPDFFASWYGISFPKRKYEDLAKEGLIRESTNKEALIHMKAGDLKEIATEHGLKVSGKKEDLCTRIKENVSEDELSKYSITHYWVITETGKVALDSNKYVDLYVGKHKYSLMEANIGIEDISRKAQNLSMPRCRDLIWSEFNRISGDTYLKANKTGNFKSYCNLLRTMALFLEEEQKYKPALQQYSRYLFYKINFEGPLKGAYFYKSTNDLNSASDIFLCDAELMPYEIGEINDLGNEASMSEDEVNAFFAECFDREQDIGLFNSNELVSFIVLAMRRDRDGLRKMYTTTFKKKVLKK